MNEKTLSVFVDESGRFRHPDPDSRFYIVSLVLHDQSVDISSKLDALDLRLRDLHIEKLCFHAGPLIRQEKVFAVMDRSFRYRIFAAMMAFARHVDFRYRCLVVDKKNVTSSAASRPYALWPVLKIQPCQPQNHAPTMGMRRMAIDSSDETANETAAVATIASGAVRRGCMKPTTSASTSM